MREGSVLARTRAIRDTRDSIVMYHATTMLTVPEAAKRTGRNPETVRRWIREGKLRAHKVGTQHVIDERDLEAVEASRHAAAAEGVGEDVLG